MAGLIVSRGVFQDLRANAAFANESDGVSEPRGEPSLVALAKTLLTVRYTAVLLFRVSSTLGRIASPLGSLAKQLNHLITGADVAWQASVGPGLVLFHPTGVVIGAACKIGQDCWIQQGVTLGGKHVQRPNECPVLGDGVQVGAGARVIGAVSIGDRASIGANAVVTASVPADMIAVGIPARVRARQS